MQFSLFTVGECVELKGGKFTVHSIGKDCIVLHKLPGTRFGTKKDLKKYVKMDMEKNPRPHIEDNVSGTSYTTKESEVADTGAPTIEVKKEDGKNKDEVLNQS